MRVINSKKSMICTKKELPPPKGYDLLDSIFCLKCAQTFYVYTPYGVNVGKGLCPYCDSPFELTILFPNSP